MKKVLMLILVAALFALAACGSGDSEEPEDNQSGGEDQEQDQEEANEEEDNEEANSDMPEKLVMGFVPSQDSETIASTAQPLADKLSEELGIPVEATTMTNYTGLIEALGNGQAHIGFLPAFGYVLASNEYDVEVILKSERHGSATYVAQYLVRNDSPVESLEDLEEHAGDMIWAYGDPSSTSGYLFPASQMMSMFDLDNTTQLQNEFFKATTKSGGHDNSAAAVVNGQADIATTFDDVRDTMGEEYPDIKEKTKIIGTTEEIPNDTITLPSDLNEELKQKIEEAFLSFNEDKEMLSIMNEVYSWDAIIEADDSDYDVVRETYNNLGGDVPLD